MKEFLFSATKKRQYLLLFGDTAIVVLAILLAYVVRVYFNKANFRLDMVINRLDPLQAIVIFLHLFSFYLMDLYNVYHTSGFIRTSTKIFLSVLIAGLTISGVFFFFPKYIFGRQVLMIHLTILIFLMTVWRRIIYILYIRKLKPKRLAVVGDGQIISSFIEELEHLPDNSLRAETVCIADDKSGMQCSLPENLATYRSIAGILESEDFDILAYETTKSVFTENETRQILQLKHDGKAVYDLSNLYKKVTGKVPVSYIDGRWLLYSNGFQGEYQKPYAQLKRIIDIGLSAVLMLIFAPLILLLAIMIRLDSKGRVFFVQERLGIKRRPFKCIKFRTMIDNAENRSGPIWSRKEDPRITRVGKFLRKSRLDELPQLWNILKGEMSFVGPRPIREHFADKLDKVIPYYGLRFLVKPGLSGWAQVNHDYAGSEEGQIEKFQYELFYVENMSLFLDLYTIFKTLRKVIRAEGT